MKILLQRDVPHLGKAGEAKEVKEGYARNFLIPHSLAVPATAAALQRRSHEREQHQRASEAERKKTEELAARLKHLTLEIQEKATSEGKLYGGIHRERIVQALRDQGIMIETQSIVLKEPLKTIGSRPVEIHLKFGLKTKIEINVVPE